MVAPTSWTVRLKGNKLPSLSSPRPTDLGLESIALAADRFRQQGTYSLCHWVSDRVTLGEAALLTKGKLQNLCILIKIQYEEFLKILRTHFLITTATFTCLPQSLVLSTC